MSWSRREKWDEMRELGRRRFVWRERALRIGVPVSLVVAVVLGFRPSSLWDWISPEAVMSLWIPLLVGVLAAALYGYAEWDREQHAADRSETDQQEG
ncbi:MAG TPA: hypothetical protein VJR92_06595 [Gemmatimonadaceae bacterium]|nr:hypothetical protein [Gemmatimonadaceae bacterium]